MRHVAIVFLLLALALTACHPRSTVAPSPVATPAAIKSKIDICSLLTSGDLKEVQGEAYQDAQRSDRLDGEFIVAQCYYALPTTVNSVVVSVTTANNDAGARSPKAFWEQTFGKYDENESEGKTERAPEKTERPRAREDNEEKESAPPEPMKDLGDEAFWVGSPIGGALYVLKSEMIFRLSVGGAGDQKAKLNKSKALAQKILKKL